MMRRIGGWVGERLGRLSGGRLRLGEGLTPPGSATSDVFAGREGVEQELELEDRREAL